MKPKLLRPVYEYYDSSTRKNKYGNPCEQCRKNIEGQCKRVKLGRDSFGHMQYAMVCMKCWTKYLPHEIKSAEEYLKNYVNERKAILKKLRKEIKQ